jgi:hypothetical protein
MLAVRIGSRAGYWTAVFPVAVPFGLGLASLLPPPSASAMNSAPGSQAGLASGVNNAVAAVAGLLWSAELPPITGLTARPASEAHPRDHRARAPLDPASRTAACATNTVPLSASSARTRASSTEKRVVPATEPPPSVHHMTTSVGFTAAA